MLKATTTLTGKEAKIRIKKYNNNAYSTLFDSSVTKRLRGEFSSLDFMAFQFLNVNALLKKSAFTNRILRKFASSMYLINRGESEWNNQKRVLNEDRIFNAVTLVVA